MRALEAVAVVSVFVLVLALMLRVAVPRGGLPPHMGLFNRPIAYAILKHDCEEKCLEVIRAVLRGNLASVKDSKLRCFPLCFARV